jgi:hypothetical protein
MSPLKKWSRRAGLALSVVFVALQFLRPEKNLGAAESSYDLLVQHPAPPEVKQLLAVACYDCHSNRTRYPWYAEVQPLGWWLAQHVDDAKHALNFSEFSRLTTKRAKSKLEACIDEIEDRKMPLPSYTLTHHDARLSDAQIKMLIAWLEETTERIDAAGR